MFVHLAERNIKSMLVGTALAFGFIAIVMVIALRDWRLGFLSLIPNVIPVAITFGIWSLTVGYIGIIASIIAATSLGLIVDDTVHLLTKYARFKRKGNLNTHEAIIETFTHVGKALWVTSLVLAAGFLVLSLSSFRLNQEMGVMTAITLVVALVLDFLLLPAILMAFHRDPECACNVCQCVSGSELSNSGVGS
jgi:predicted RND superfamily exporter protein